MKKIIIGILITLFGLTLFAAGELSQEEKNRIFLTEMDANIISTIDVLVAFNTISNNMEEVDGVELYRRFLMDMTLECAKIRNHIEKAKQVKGKALETSINLLILQLRSDVILQEGFISAEADKKNRILLHEYEQVLNKKITAVRKNLIKEERNITETYQISREYMGYHSRHFLLSLLLDYVPVSIHLSKENRDFLTQIVTSMMSEL